MCSSLPLVSQKSLATISWIWCLDQNSAVTVSLLIQILFLRTLYCTPFLHVQSIRLPRALHLWVTEVCMTVNAHAVLHKTNPESKVQNLIKNILILNKTQLSLPYTLSPPAELKYLGRQVCVPEYFCPWPTRIDIFWLPKVWLRNMICLFLFIWFQVLKY